MQKRMWRKVLDMHSHRWQSPRVALDDPKTRVWSEPCDITWQRAASWLGVKGRLAPTPRSAETQ